jgi:hypothetical protein
MGYCRQAIKSHLASPGIAGVHVPDIAFQVATSETAAAVGLVFDLREQ